MDILARANWVDLLVVIAMLRIGYVAFEEGFSHEIFPLIAIICNLILSLRYYNKLAIILSKHMFNLPMDLSAFISFTALVVGLGFIFRFIKAVLDKIIKITWHSTIEKFGGLIVGLVRASILISMILIIITLVPLSYLTWSVTERSLTGMYFLKIGPAIYAKVAVLLPAEGAAPTSDEILKRLTAGKQAPEKAKERKKSQRELELEKAFQLH